METVIAASIAAIAAVANTLLSILIRRRTKEIADHVNSGTYLPLRNIHGQLTGYVEQSPKLEPQGGRRREDVAAVLEDATAHPENRRES